MKTDPAEFTTAVSMLIALAKITVLIVERSKRKFYADNADVVQSVNAKLQWTHRILTIAMKLKECEGSCVCHAI
jgi:hypothetical protein